MIFGIFLSDKYLSSSLKRLVKKNGIRGCWDYWEHALNEEAADFMMELDEKADVFKIIMHYCPSKGRLLKWRRIKPYADYCRHCDVLYRRILEPLGYCYAPDFSQADHARCSIVITRKNDMKRKLTNRTVARRSIMLMKSQLIGPWAGLPIAWKDDNTFDEKTYRNDVARSCAAGVPGVYTGGTTGEFYALEFDEFKAVTEATIRECRNGKKPVMIGCTSTFTLGAIRRARYAMEKGADAVQIALPFWMELTDAEVIDFFKEVSAAVPGMPLTIYETLRAKKAISLKAHTLIHEAVPAVIGVKSNADTLGHTPEGCAELSKFYHVFVGENMWHELGPSGAIGCCSSLVYQNPRIVLQVFDLVLKKKWLELKVWMDKFNHIIFEGLKPCFDIGCQDSALDRLLGLSAGFLKTSLHCRKPYTSCTQAHLVQFRKWLKNNHPEFLEL